MLTVTVTRDQVHIRMPHNDQLSLQSAMTAAHQLLEVTDHYTSLTLV